MTIATDIYLEAVGSYLPEHREKLVDAVAELPGPETERVLATGYDTVAVETELYPGDMAVRAAEQALSLAGAPASSVGMISVSAIHRNGHKRLWSPASYVQNALGNDRAIPFNLMQGCNGNMIGLQLACDHLARSRYDERVIAAATDRFGTSSFNRYTSDYGIVYGDGSGAFLVSRKRGALKVTGLHTVSNPGMESLHRTAEPLPETAELLSDEHDVRAAKRGYLAEHGKGSLSVRTSAAVSAIRDELLPGDAQDSLRHIVFPNLGHGLLSGNYFTAFTDGERKSLWDLGRTIGHLGSGDAAVGMSHLITTGQLDKGDKVLLLGAGAGFTWTGALIEVVARP
ncbi:ketoacyl-ACP synthase III family protein [Amycolatopsis sp. H20-H5]|uniref:ketoacyl-ACP synthase III family protein n=1 Tax=Amycolatopsis sp. H20-H5 TaxID=3046309 RepID=UPI002DBDF6AB|nr:ketoacyl-ACP synthase III family protein [Amycolatopsis sp. H20-H5]MEC3977526.1 ketoacyl-ACP synthase III family protein [Amycolatopsis sp. H20-H5]